MVCSDLKKVQNHRDPFFLLLYEDTEVAFFNLNTTIAIKLMDSEAAFFLCGLRWPSLSLSLSLSLSQKRKKGPFSLGQAHFDSLIPAPEWPFSNSNGDRYIKAALQPLGNIFRNQNSLALMTE